MSRQDADFVVRIENCPPADLQPFVDIRATRSASAEWFIGEGIYIVRRMLRSDYSVKSLLLEENALETLADEIPSDCQVILATRQQMQDVVGFAFHRGVVACAARRPQITFCIESARARIAAWNQYGASNPGTCRPVIPFLAGVTDPENVGSIIRSAAGLGSPFVLLGDNSCDPFSRRVLRVSMGASLSIPTFHVASVEACLLELRKHDWISVATSLSANAVQLGEFELSTNQDQPVVFLIGNEATGLSAELEKLADYLLTIPMSQEIDSLNAGVAAAIFLHQLSQ